MKWIAYIIVLTLGSFGLNCIPAKIEWVYIYGIFIGCTATGILNERTD